MLQIPMLLFPLNTNELHVVLPGTRQVLGEQQELRQQPEPPGQTHSASRDLPFSAALAFFKAIPSTSTEHSRTSSPREAPSHRRQPPAHRTVPSPPQHIAQSAPYNRFYGFPSISQQLCLHLGASEMAAPSQHHPTFPLPPELHAELRRLSQHHDNSRQGKASPGAVSSSPGSTSRARSSKKTSQSKGEPS